MRLIRVTGEELGEPSVAVYLTDGGVWREEAVFVACTLRSAVRMFREWRRGPRRLLLPAR